MGTTSAEGILSQTFVRISPAGGGEENWKTGKLGRWVTLVEDFAVVFPLNCDLFAGAAQEGVAGFVLST